MIETVDLTKRYGDVAAVDALSLKVEDGELLVLLGGSGSGKTTTLKMINRLIEPTSGHVTIDGQDARAFEPYELRRRIGYVFQKIGLFPHMTIADNVAVTLTLIGWDASRIQGRVDELLELVELAPDAVRERRPTELSGGQQQRVGVARALAASPRLMLLDEPFGGVDIAAIEGLIALLQSIRRAGVTILVIEHNLGAVMRLADRLIAMNLGSIIAEGTPDSVTNDPMVVRAYLGDDGADNAA
jgi:osmoprotectant transport system ATP-binding protein